MKYIILFLFATLAHADIEARRNADSYIFRFVQDGVVHCWGMPDYADLNFFSPTWMRVTDTAQAYSWPIGNADLATACNENLPVIPKVRFETMYGLNADGRIVATGTVPIGTPCGERMSDITFLRTVTYNGRFGMGICF